MTASAASGARRPTASGSVSAGSASALTSRSLSAAPEQHLELAGHGERTPQPAVSNREVTSPR